MGGDSASGGEGRESGRAVRAGPPVRPAADEGRGDGGAEEGHGGCTGQLTPPDHRLSGTGQAKPVGNPMWQVVDFTVVDFTVMEQTCQ